MAKQKQKEVDRQIAELNSDSAKSERAKAAKQQDTANSGVSTFIVIMAKINPKINKVELSQTKQAYSSKEFKAAEQQALKLSTVANTYGVYVIGRDFYKKLIKWYEQEIGKQNKDKADKNPTNDQMWAIVKDVEEGANLVCKNGNVVTKDDTLKNKKEKKQSIDAAVKALKQKGQKVTIDPSEIKNALSKNNLTDSKFYLSLGNKQLGKVESELDPVVDLAKQFLTKDRDVLTLRISVVSKEGKSLKSLPLIEFNTKGEIDVGKTKANLNKILLGESLISKASEIDEKSFDKSINEYLSEVYANVKSYKTNSCKLTEEAVIFEGELEFKDGNKKYTSFRLSPVSGNNNEAIFEGMNSDISDSGKAFRFHFINKNSTVITEQLSYRYNISESLVEGKINV